MTQCGINRNLMKLDCQEKNNLQNLLGVVAINEKRQSQDCHNVEFLLYQNESRLPVDIWITYLF